MMMMMVSMRGRGLHVLLKLLKRGLGRRRVARFHGSAQRLEIALDWR